MGNKKAVLAICLTALIVVIFLGSGFYILYKQIDNLSHQLYEERMYDDVVLVKDRLGFLEGGNLRLGSYRFSMDTGNYLDGIEEVQYVLRETDVEIQDLGEGKSYWVQVQFGEELNLMRATHADGTAYLAYYICHVNAGNCIRRHTELPIQVPSGSLSLGN